MIHNVQGNLLTSDCYIIAHQCNCLMGFGSGIAKQIREQYPEAYQAFIKDNRTADAKLGSLCYAESNGKLVFNLYGQFDYGREKGKLYTVYPALEKAVCNLFLRVAASKKYAPNNEFKVGMPRLIGCGLAGGDWDNIVYPMLVQRSAEFGINLWLYEYTP